MKVAMSAAYQSQSGDQAFTVFSFTIDYMEYRNDSEPSSWRRI